MHLIQRTVVFQMALKRHNSFSKTAAQTVQLMFSDKLQFGRSSPPSKTSSDVSQSLKLVTLLTGHVRVWWHLPSQSHGMEKPLWTLEIIGLIRLTFIWENQAWGTIELAVAVSLLLGEPRNQDQTPKSQSPTPVSFHSGVPSFWNALVFYTLNQSFK